jgi:hypothetical protein
MDRKRKKLLGKLSVEEIRANLKFFHWVSIRIVIRMMGFQFHGFCGAGGKVLVLLLEMQRRRQKVQTGFQRRRRSKAVKNVFLTRDEMYNINLKRKITIKIF